MLRSIFILLLSFSITTSALSDDDNATYWYITVPFKSSDLQNAKLIKSTNDLLSNKYSSEEETRNAEITYFNKYIKHPDITNLERSYLLLMRADTYRKIGEHQKSAEKLTEIAKTGSLPKSKMKNAFYSLYQMAYAYGNFNLAAKAFSQYTSLNPRVFPWDHAALAEIMIKANRYDLALIKLDAAITMLKQHNCPIEPNWQNLLTALQENNLEKISDVKNATLPYIYMPLNDVYLLPQSRKQAIYPRKALARGIQGFTLVQSIIDQDGTPLCVMPGGITLGHMDFYEAAKVAALKLRYKPANERSVTGWSYGIRTRFTFKIGARRR